MQVHQHDRQQAAEHRPGQEAPVHERLGQGQMARLLAVRLHAGEQRRRTGEVHQRLGGRPEGATAGQQCAHDHGDPVEGTDVRLPVDAAQADATALAEEDPEADDEGRQHQHLPVEPEDFRRPGEQGIDQRRHGVDIHQRGHQEGEQEAAADGEQGPVDALQCRVLHRRAAYGLGREHFHDASRLLFCPRRAGLMTMGG
ncbi:hypothetical protein D9M71_498080 [compost metagenome]